MRIIWSNDAISDLRRLRSFLADVNPRSSKMAFETLRRSPQKLLEHPRLGSRLDDFEAREVRRLIIGNYELRYEIRENAIVVLRIWHAREDR